MTIAVSGFAAFASNFKAWLAKEEAAIKPVLSKFVADVEQDLEIAFEDLASLAGAAVLKQAPLVLSGQEKFGAAVTDVIQTVEADGKTVATKTAQTAVQQAYDGIKDFAKTATS